MKNKNNFAVVKDGNLILPNSSEHETSKLVRLTETESGQHAAFESLLSRSRHRRKLSARQTIAAPTIRRKRSMPPVPPLVVVEPRSGLLITGATPELAPEADDSEE